MQFSEALAAIRDLDGLAEPRRRYLVTLAANARTDADRALIVLEARAEDRSVRDNLDADFSAELRARAEWATRNPSAPSDAPQRPSGRGQRIDRDDATTPKHRPVSTRYVEPTKVATEKQTRERKPLMGKNKVYPAEPVTLIKKPKPIKHGTSSGYRSGCRCEGPGGCKEWKALSRKGIGRVRRANGEPAPHGTTTNYARGCRCRMCRDAVNAHARMKRAEKRSAQPVDPAV